jgi:hypothetical protein
MNNQKIRQYDVVRILAINRVFNKNECEPGIRCPEIDDIATVIGIYEKPKLGYELESVGNNGETNWLVSVSSEDLEYEIIGNINIDTTTEKAYGHDNRKDWKCKCPCHKLFHLVVHPVPCCVPCPYCAKFVARGKLEMHLSECKKYSENKEKNA